jgi:O-antigen/teichoic acid export membrane protein
MIPIDADNPNNVPGEERPSRIVARNSAIMLTRQVANWLIATILVLLVPRYLGDAGLGQLQFGQSFASLVSIGVGLGMGQMLTREIARKKEDAQALFHTAFTVRLVSAGIAIAVVVIAVSVSGIRGESAAVIYAATASMLLLSTGRMGVSILYGREDMTKVAIADTVSRIIAAILGIIVLLNGNGAFEYAITILIGSAIHSAIIFISANREMPIRPGFSTYQAKRLLTGAMPFAITGGILTLYNQADTIMVRTFAGEAVLGWHAAAMRLIGATEIVPAAIATALLPTLSRTFVSDRAGSESLSKRTVAIATALLVPVAFVLASNAARILDILPIPDVFSNSAPVLVVLAISIPVTAMLTITGAIATGSNRQKMFMVTMATGLSTNIALNAVLIPYYQDHMGNGGTGAAVATLTSEIVILLIMFRVLASEAFGKTGLLGLSKVAVATTAMSLLAWAGSASGLHWSLWNVAALVVYVVLVAAFRIITRSDINVVIESIRRRRSAKP